MAYVGGRPRSLSPSRRRPFWSGACGTPRASLAARSARPSCSVTSSLPCVSIRARVDAVLCRYALRHRPCPLRHPKCGCGRGLNGAARVPCAVWQSSLRNHRKQEPKLKAGSSASDPTRPGQQQRKATDEATGKAEASGGSESARTASDAASKRGNGRQPSQPGRQAGRGTAPAPEQAAPSPAHAEPGRAPKGPRKSAA